MSDMKQFGRGIASAVAASALLACADGTGPGGERLTLSFTNQTLAAGIAARPSGAAAVVITRATVVLSEVELEPADLNSCTRDDSDSDGFECEEIESGPYLVELPVDNSVRSTLGVSIPAGQYREIEYEIDRVDDDDPTERAFLAANPSFRDVSIRVEGTYNGAPFVYLGRFEVEIELEFSPPVVVDGTTNNITVAVDMARWFRTQTGDVIDPNTANRGGANESLVANNIRNSFDAFEDDDHDGRQDD